MDTSRQQHVRVWVAVFTAVTFAASGCSTSQPGPAKKPELRIGIAFGPATLDPAKDGIGQSMIVHLLTHATITHLNPDGSITGQLASSFHYVGTGNQEFEFTLRPDARFSDGSPVTAAAVKGWLEYFAKANGPFAAFGAFTSIDAVDERTVDIKLATPNPNVPRLLSQALNWGMVSSPKGIATPAGLGTQTFGAGPYVLVAAETVANDHYTFAPNQQYYDQRAIRFSKVVVKVIANASSMLQALQTGQVDLAAGDISTADAAQAAGLNVVSYPVGFNALILLDRAGKETKPLADLRVRQALNYAIDRPAIAKALAGKWATPTSQVITTHVQKPIGADMYPYDPAKAKSLLAQAGYPGGFTLKVLDIAGGFPNHQLTQATATYLQAVGVKVEITTAPTVSEFIQKLFGGGFAAVQFGQGLDDTWFFYEVNVMPKAVLNPYGATDPVMEGLAREASTLDGAAALPRWQQLVQRFTAEAWDAPLISNTGLYYAAKRIDGVVATAIAQGPDPTTIFPSGK